MTAVSRRRFLGGLGGAAFGATGLVRPSNAQAGPVVKMGNNYFDPIGLHVEPGTTVRFEIEAGSHSATAYPDRVPSEATVFDSGTISEGGFEHTFETAGTYDYYCIPHKSVGMVGRIVVGTPGGPAEDGSIPDGEVPTSEAIVEQGTVAFGSDTDGSGNTDGGMMRPGGHGMTGGRLSQGIGGRPVAGGVLAMFGVVGGGLYWLLHRGDTPTDGDDSARLALRKQYARGDIDEEEFQRRRKRLEDGEEPPPK